MRQLSAEDAWDDALSNSKTNLNYEDLQILSDFKKMLGKTNIEGQVSEIELMENFIDSQIVKAEEEQKKNERLYKNLGLITGIAIVIIFI